MANLSTYYPAPITAADLGLGAGSNATFGSIQNTPIGSTTASSGSFTTLAANNGTLTASAPVLDLAQTWNNAATTFTGFRFNVTNTASASASNVAVWQIDGSTRWAINRGGDLASTTNGVSARSVNVGVFGPADLSINSNSAAIRLGIIDDTNLQREGTGVLAQRSASTAQTFRLYNTFTDASNHERLFIRGQTGGAFQIGTEKAGTGSARALEFQTDGTTRLTIGSGGNVTLPSGSSLAFGTGCQITNFSTTILKLEAGFVANLCTLVSGYEAGVTGLGVQNGAHLGFSGNSNSAVERDAIWFRDAAGTIAQRNGTNAQESRLYGTFTNSTNYQRMTVKSVKQTLSALSGASATTTGTFIPDGAVVVGVTTRVATLLTGAAGYTIGDGTDADRWGDITGTAVGTTSDNRDWTAGTVECFTAGGNITLTAKTSNFTAGAIEVCAFYLAGEAD